MTVCERCKKPTTERRMKCLSCGRLLCRTCRYVWTDSGPPLYACDTPTFLPHASTDCGEAQREQKQQQQTKDWVR